MSRVREARVLAGMEGEGEVGVSPLHVPRYLLKLI